VPPTATAPPSRSSLFYGWIIVGTAFLTFGLAVGVPYYNLPFFYDYFQKSFGWSLNQITLGFPIAALLTIWIGPLLIPKVSQRKMIVAGTGLTAVALFGFGTMSGSLATYFGLYFVYTIGYIFSGPIPHQILVSHWFRAKRGRAMGVTYVGVGLFGGLGSFLVRAVTDHYGFRAALFTLAGCMFLAWPLALLLLRDNPGQMGQFADGALEPAAEIAEPPHTYRFLLQNRSFWLLLLGSIASIGSIGSINLHMKFVFRDAGFSNQASLNAAWTTASVIILWSSIIGRLGIGYLADLLSKKRVMACTYLVVALTILLLSAVSPRNVWSVYVFALMFGLSMGADYMLIPLMAAEQFGVRTLARSMAIILPANTIGQTWFPYFVSAMREHFGSYVVPLSVVFGVAMLGALAILALPSRRAASS
jgi:MFS family permease